jgi:hypothetical protein
MIKQGESVQLMTVCGIDGSAGIDRDADALSATNVAVASPAVAVARGKDNAAAGTPNPAASVGSRIHGRSFGSLGCKIGLHLARDSGARTGLTGTECPDPFGMRTITAPVAFPGAVAFGAVLKNARVVVVVCGKLSPGAARVSCKLASSLKLSLAVVTRHNYGSELSGMPEPRKSSRYARGPAPASVAVRVRLALTPSHLSDPARGTCGLQSARMAGFAATHSLGGIGLSPLSISRQTIGQPNPRQSVVNPRVISRRHSRGLVKAANGHRHLICATLSNKGQWCTAMRAERAQPPGPIQLSRLPGGEPELARSE